MTQLGDKLLYGLVMMSLFWGGGRKRRQMEAAMGPAGVLWFAAISRVMGPPATCPSSCRNDPFFLRNGGRCVPAVTFLIAKTIEECVIIFTFA